MRRTNSIFLLGVIIVLMVNSGCASAAKPYRDATGVIKTEHRSAAGVKK